MASAKMIKFILATKDQIISLDKGDNIFEAKIYVDRETGAIYLTPVIKNPFSIENDISFENSNNICYNNNMKEENDFLQGLEFSFEKPI